MVVQVFGGKPRAERSRKELILNNFEISHNQVTFYSRNIAESIESVKDSLAFSRPNTNRNSIGFGFQEFLRVNSLYSEGFVLPEYDSLVVKAFLKSK